MADIIINVIFFALQLGLLIGCYCLAKKHFESVFSIAVIAFLGWLTINNFTGAVLFSVFKQNIGIISIVLAMFIECVGLFICIKCVSKKEIHKYMFWSDSKNIITFSVVAVCLFLFFFLVLTKCTFMPVYGNVDEVVHYDLVNGILQKMWVNPQKVKYLSVASHNMTYFINERLSYIWGYHYIAAIVSKMFCIDTIYITHFIRSLMMTLMLSIPILALGKVKNKVFAYFFYFAIVIGTIPCWFLFLISGFTAQMYSIVFIEIAIILFSELNVFFEKHDLAINIFCASLIWATFNGYILTGAILLAYYVFNCLLNKRWKNIIGSFVAIIPLGLYPSMRTQISAFFTRSENKDEALSAQYFGVKYLNWHIIIFFILIAVLYVIAKKVRENKKMLGISAITTITLLTLWILGDREGYIIYKLFFSMYLFVMLDFIMSVDLLVFDDAPNSEQYQVPHRIIRFVLRKVTACIIGIITVVYLIYGCGLVNYKSIRNTFDIPEPMLTKNLYDCVKFIKNDDSLLRGDFDCIGVYGPQIWCSVYVYLGKEPISSWATPEKNTIIFTGEGSATVQRVLDGLMVMFQEEKQAEYIILIVDKNYADLYDRIPLYRKIVKSECDIYENDRYLIKKLDIISACKAICYDMEDLKQYENEGFIISDIMFYGSCIIPKQINTEYKININMQNINHVDVLQIGGRSIHNSEMKLIISDMEGKKYTIDIDSFEYLTEVDLSEYDIKELQLSVTANNFEDGIILNNISLYNYEK